MKDEKLTLKQLISKYGWVLDHPILSELVRVALSPKSVDNYIVNRFSDYAYKNELAKAVRNAVRIRDLAKGKDNILWKELLKPPEDSKFSDMFVFGEKQYYSVRSGCTITNSIHFAIGIKLFLGG